MPEWSLFVVFLGTTLMLLVMPGPAVLYIIARSIDQGRMAGVVSALGVAVGSFVHVMAAVLGISALLVSSALAFNIVKYAGACYLVYLGVRTLLERKHSGSMERVPAHQRLSRIFAQGILVNILNPKVALFFFAFLPQFVTPSAGSVAGQLFLLGVVFVGLGILSDSLYAVLAGTARRWLHRHSSGRFVQAQRYVAGGTYITLGVATALTGTKHT